MSRDPQQSAAGSGEFTLYDVWNVFVRRRWTFVGVVALFLAASVGYFMLQDPDYRITGRVEIGGRSVDGDFRPLATPSNVANRLKGDFIPLAAQRQLGGDGDTAIQRSQLLDRISANAAPGTEVVRVFASSSAENLELYKGVLSVSLNRLVETHAQYAEIMDISTRERLEALRNQIATLKEDREKKSAQISRVENLQAQIERELESLQETIDSIQDTRLSIMNENASVDASVATMFAANDLREARAALTEKRERAYFQLPNRLDELNFDVAQIDREIELKQLQLQELKAESGLIRKTRIIEQPGDYLERRAASPIITVASGGILGVIAAVFAVLFAEFSAAARARRTTSPAQATR